MRPTIQTSEAVEHITPEQTSLCLLFCGLLVAYKTRTRLGEYVRMMGLPPMYARLAE